MKPYQNQRGCDVIQVVHSKTLEGNGTPEDVYRLVDWYYSLDGTLLAKYDVEVDNLHTYEPKLRSEVKL